MAMDKEKTVHELREAVRAFISERDWDQFHSAKNISMSLAIEAAELMEIFQWHERKSAEDLTNEERSKVEHEVADIVIYAMDFCNQFKIDLSRAILEKLQHNADKYPADKVRGKTHKYTHYQQKEKPSSDDLS